MNRSSRRLRKALGDELPIVVTHDAHANVAPQEIELSTALVIYKEVPHVDQKERGIHAAEIVIVSVIAQATGSTTSTSPPPVDVDGFAPDSPLTGGVMNRET